MKLARVNLVPAVSAVVVAAATASAVGEVAAVTAVVADVPVVAVVAAAEDLPGANPAGNSFDSLETAGGWKSNRQR